MSASSSGLSSDIYESNITAPPAFEDSKTTFFKELERLNQSSDEEEDADTNSLRKVRFPHTSDSKIFLAAESRLNNPKRSATITKQVPTIQRTTSAPVRTAVAEITDLRRKTSLLRYDISVEATPNTSFAGEPLPITQQTNNTLMNERRTVSAPSIGSVSMTNSLGITNMLKKNTKREALKPSKKAVKRKAAALEMKPEVERIFNGKVFYYIPNDDVAPLRKQRIDTAVSYGAVWTREWTSAITHVIVESNLTFQEISKWLKDQLKVSRLVRYNSID